MRLNISGLNELRERLERLRPEEVMARALAEQAQRMAARVRDGLSEPSGAAGHDEPWLRAARCGTAWGRRRTGCGPWSAAATRPRCHRSWARRICRRVRSWRRRRRP